VVKKSNYMPTYTMKCPQCGGETYLYLGNVTTDDVINIPCRKCGSKILKKIPCAINSANFKKGSRKSLKTRTGVGEVQFARGADKVIEEANK